MPLLFNLRIMVTADWSPFLRISRGIAFTLVIFAEFSRWQIFDPEWIFKAEVYKRFYYGSRSNASV